MKDRAIICDIDGTLAIRGSRKPFEYHRCTEDTVRGAVARLLHRYEALRDHPDYQVHILMVSGREEVCRRETETWLQANAIPYDLLLMRPAHDYRKDAIVKREIYERDIAPSFDVELVIDDRDQVVQMWRRDLHLPCFQVDYGDF